MSVALHKTLGLYRILTRQKSFGVDKTETLGNVVVLNMYQVQGMSLALGESYQKRAASWEAV